MKGILLTAKDCEVCPEVKRELSSLLQSGEVIEKCFDDVPEEVMELMERYEIDRFPSLLILGDNDQLIGSF